jgi:hypothetical protein
VIPYRDDEAKEHPPMTSDDAHPATPADGAPPPPPPVVTSESEPPTPPVVVETASPAPAGPIKSLKILSWIVLAAGVILIVAGAVTWFIVKDQLADEKITVSSDADYFAGDKVDGPLTAYSQADIINHHALEASGGKTYAELEQDDPARQTVMTASFLRASLFTSVVSFGVAAFAAGVGVAMLIIGFVLLKITGELAALRAQFVAASAA